jgi:hypothetical protein
VLIPLTASVLMLAGAAPVASPVVTEPRTGLVFPTRIGAMSLLGVGARTKSLLKFRVYALGLYVSDAALAGPLAAHKGRVNTSAFYRDLTQGDFEKQFVLKLARDLSAEQIQGTFRSHMPSADRQLLDQFASYFGVAKAGDELVLRWVPGGSLETTIGGSVKRPIANKAFADEVFAIWLRDRSGEDPLRKQVVSRAHQLIR